MEFLASVLATLQRGLFGWVTVAVVLTVFELLNARERIGLRQRAAGMAYWTVSIAASAVIATAAVAMTKAYGIMPLVNLPVFSGLAWAGPLAALIAVVLAATVNDFFFYCYHRIQHRWLWRYHAVHHSVRDLTAVNSYHHISETVIGLLLAIPTTLVICDVGPALPFVSLILYLHIVWIHSPTRINLGPLRILFADNNFHRIHHSLEERHFDKNFGAFTTLWDRLFGTAHFPSRDEWPDVGLAEVDQPRTLKEWVDLPTRYRNAVIAPADHPMPVAVPG
ncbi:sterol desaturase family protein [Sphingomonas sp.]|jgi:sterol desaturase/sphingolipid hydroxylase (fatty acid hydroxylase superfamily)|uniref:sterol desaturase family protein n=1 Tax=Sphingomonas sp. TaxID=28214 RepID=UPI002D807B21|nr:sterol desaturase family protein [Sphingomonas sp.]HEU0045709.1 sterol desaturase family protein [Sphingomonas sp.]